MKNLILMMFFIPTLLWASSVEELSQKIGEDVKRELKKDEDKFRKNPVRLPASAPVVEKIKPEEPSKIDKNVRQIGPNEW